ncbi:protein arginine N-methyltransferase [Chloropicon primus]|uniref:Protein arginine N-methyltransferase n=1 Tax=Chloropicon primus TaxID=1764295 RepID=A0A5B8MC69_9CHLO|nr:protein arginine N-methyltransferase [Chloropicon primus]|eukprot:QDZ18066.1 protein arginine N-methyltransferase [Chloropicon primus]
MVTAEDEGTPPLEGDTPLPWDNEGFLAYATWVTFAPLLDVLSCPEAYGDAIFFNDSLFQGKVVLDVGCGVLGFFAALAGARKVYILPDTKEEFFARQLMQFVHDTKLGGDTVTVYDENIAKKQDIQGKVDIILSDLAGDVWLQHSKIYRLLNARDRYLKPNGAMYPSHCKVFLAPAASASTEFESEEPMVEVCDEEESHGQRTKRRRGMGKRGRASDGLADQQRYDVRIESPELVAPFELVKTMDLLTATSEDVRSMRLDCRFNAEQSGEINLLAGWLSVQFHGSPASPALVEVDCDPCDVVLCHLEIAKKPHESNSSGAKLEVAKPSNHFLRRWF